MVAVVHRWPCDQCSVHVINLDKVVYMIVRGGEEGSTCKHNHIKWHLELRYTNAFGTTLLNDERTVTEVTVGD